MTNNILTTTTNLIYIPEFNFNTGKYQDKIPYEPYQRNRPIYECRCRSGFFFNKTNEFNQHIKTSTHLHFSIPCSFLFFLLCFKGCVKTEYSKPATKTVQSGI